LKFLREFSVNKGYVVTERTGVLWCCDKMVGAEQQTGVLWCCDKLLGAEQQTGVL